MTIQPGRIMTETTQASTVSWDAPRLDDDDVRTSLMVARYARRTYPGPIGELVENALHRYVEIGYRLDPGDLQPRLVATLAAAAQAEEPSPDKYDHLPARYRPGSPLQWDYW